MKKLFVTIVLILAVFVVSIPQASAQNQIIYACVQKSSGTMRWVSGPGPCKSTETQISWNVQGPKGDTGATGPMGPPGPAGVSGDVIPPTIIHDAPPTYEGVPPASIVVNVSITDNTEIAFYALLGTTNPQANGITFVDPGKTSLNFQVPMPLQQGLNTFSVIASDSSGNISKSKIAVNYILPCVPGTPCGEVANLGHCKQGTYNSTCDCIGMVGPPSPCECLQDQDDLQNWGNACANAYDLGVISAQFQELYVTGNIVPAEDVDFYKIATSKPPNGFQLQISLGDTIDSEAYVKMSVYLVNCGGPPAPTTSTGISTDVRIYQEDPLTPSTVYYVKVYRTLQPIPETCSPYKITFRAQ